MYNNTLSVFDVANWFLKKEPMTHKKLQKLCYYAQAWNQALNGKNMFNGDFEAWVHGPVNRTLWDRLKYLGYNNVPPNTFSSCAKKLSEQDESILESVWNTYGRFSGFDLERLTHQERPWIEARDGVGEFEPTNNTISPATMREYYNSLISGEGVGEQCQKAL